MKKLFTARRFWFVSVLLVADGLFFTLTDPERLPSFAWIIGFVLLALTLYVLAYAVLGVGSWYGLPFKRHRRRLAGVLAGLVSGLLALQSVGELSARDVLVLLPLALIAYLYSSYAEKAFGNAKSHEP
ncbi:MAG TPA: hypothetical protein VK712_01530 [Verrucomicrobiae bacterium]|jgi:hypothetical protein|nr:hypothetical protein [Verrucomicrobiae bacterium]